MRVFLSPELMVAAHMRKRADTMAWTPGFVLDYTRAISGALQPARISWVRLMRFFHALFVRVRSPLGRAKRRVSGARKLAA